MLGGSCGSNADLLFLAKTYSSVVFNTHVVSIMINARSENTIYSYDGLTNSMWKSVSLIGLEEVEFDYTSMLYLNGLGLPDLAAVSVTSDEKFLVVGGASWSLAAFLVSTRYRCKRIVAINQKWT